MRAMVSARGSRTFTSERSCDSVERSSPARVANAARDRPVRSISARAAGERSRRYRASACVHTIVHSSTMRGCVSQYQQIMRIIAWHVNVRYRYRKVMALPTRDRDRAAARVEWPTVALIVAAVCASGPPDVVLHSAALVGRAVPSAPISSACTARCSMRQCTAIRRAPLAQRAAGVSQSEPLVSLSPLRKLHLTHHQRRAADRSGSSIRNPTICCPDRWASSARADEAALHAQQHARRSHDHGADHRLDPLLSSRGRVP